MTKKIFIVIFCVLAFSIFSILFDLSQKKKTGDNTVSIKKINEEIVKIGRRTPNLIYVGDPVGFVIEFENGKKFYIAGDTAPMADMKLVISDYYKPDVAILPAGEYFTEGPNAMAFSASLVNPKDHIIPYHYASYPMLTKDSSEISENLKKYGLADKLVVLESGKEKEIDGVKIVWLGHASLFLTSPGGKKVLIDPATPLGTFPEKYKDFTGFGKVDLVLVTHGHPDHAVTGDLDKLAEMYNPVIIPQFELGNWFQENLKNPSRVFAMVNKGATITSQEFEKVGLPTENIGGLKISVVSASHSSSIAPQP